MNIELSGKTAIVTGASRGIGRACAAALVAAGANVTISSRKSDDLENAAAEIRKGSVAGDVMAVQGNAGDEDDIARVVDTTMERFGAVDILVNNAATNPYYGPLHGIDASRANKTYQVNMLGPVLWTQRVWNAWMDEHGGAIINVASVGGFTVDLGTGYYNTTKAALIHLTRNFAAELGPGTRVNAVAPGLVKTDMARALWEEQGDEIASHLALKRLGEPDDIARSVVFLASDAASWITGHTVVIDGGAMVAPIAGM